VNTRIFNRIAEAMHKGRPSPAQRKRVVDAAQDVQSFNDLPADVQKLIKRWEKMTVPEAP
jgi:hypothetical protein